MIKTFLKTQNVAVSWKQRRYTLSVQTDGQGGDRSSLPSMLRF